MALSPLRVLTLLCALVCTRAESWCTSATQTTIDKVRRWSRRKQAACGVEGGAPAVPSSCAQPAHHPPTQPYLQRSLGLTSIPSDAFTGCTTALTTLRLDGNALASIDAGAFSTLTSLQGLYLVRDAPRPALAPIYRLPRRVLLPTMRDINDCFIPPHPPHP